MNQELLQQFLAVYGNVASLSASFVVVLCIGVALGYYFKRPMIVRPEGEWETMRRERESREKQVISDLITEAIQEAIQRGELDNEQAAKWYVRFAHILDISDLLPTQITPERQLRRSKTLKQNIRMRLKNGFHKGKIPASILPPIPQAKKEPDNALDAILAS